MAAWRLGLAENKNSPASYSDESQLLWWIAVKSWPYSTLQGRLKWLDANLELFWAQTLGTFILTGVYLLWEIIFSDNFKHQSIHLSKLDAPSYWPWKFGRVPTYPLHTKQWSKLLLLLPVAMSEITVFGYVEPHLFQWSSLTCYF